MGNISTKRVCALYFSPNGTVKKTVENIAKGTGLPYTGYDLTPFEARWNDYVFEENDLVLVALPVYGGRLPGICREFFRHVEANGAFCVPVVVYGNRAYDDALKELYMLCTEKGFNVVSAAAFIGEHCLVPQLAKGRPDEADYEEQVNFGKQIAQKIEAGTDCKTLEIKGSYPFKAQVMDRNLAPDIVKSGKGIVNPLVCPVCAIDPENADNIDQKRCLLCCRCIGLYPEYRAVPSIMKDALTALYEKNADRKQPEIYI